MFSPWPLLPAAAICIVYLAPAPKSRHWSANKRFNNPSCFMVATDTGDPALLGIPCMFLFDSVFTHTSGVAKNEFILTKIGANVNYGACSH